MLGEQTSPGFAKEATDLETARIVKSMTSN
jgi:hypothetical protein